MRYTVLNQYKEQQLEKAKKAFEVMCAQYEKIFETGFYPARKSTGFTEQNLVHNYTNALVKTLGDDAFAWLEFPWEDNKQHIDAIVISKHAKLVYYIEAKRLSVGQKKFESLHNDIGRIKKNYNQEIILNDLKIQHKIDTSDYHHCIIALADIWIANKWTKNIYDSWQQGKNLLPKFVKHTYLSNLLEDGTSSLYKDFTGNYPFNVKDYKLLIAVETL